MFHNIHPALTERMRFLEQLDEQDRTDGTPHLQRLRQVPPETGKFLALLATGAPEGPILEIGTSAGYSTLWLAIAARTLGRKVITFEVLPEKVKLARETFHAAGVEDTVELIAGDAREHMAYYYNLAFVFLDAEKEVYSDCYELIVPRLAKGGLLVADNAISHREALAPMLEHALHDERLDALIVPIGKGELVCRKV
jgi:caffeoyl-CoA O-methyltransferase